MKTKINIVRIILQPSGFKYMITAQFPRINYGITLAQTQVHHCEVVNYNYVQRPRTSSDYQCDEENLIYLFLLALILLMCLITHILLKIINLNYTVTNWA